MKKKKKITNANTNPKKAPNQYQHLFFLRKAPTIIAITTSKKLANNIPFGRRLNGIIIITVKIKDINNPARKLVNEPAFSSFLGVLFTQVG